MLNNAGRPLLGALFHVIRNHQICFSWKGTFGKLTGITKSTNRFLSWIWSPIRFIIWSEEQSLDVSRQLALSRWTLVSIPREFCLHSIIDIFSVKLKIQTQNTLPVEERKYTSIPNCYRVIYHGPGCFFLFWHSCLKHSLTEEGFSGFFRGWRPILLKVIPSASVTFCCYEFFKTVLFSIF